MRILLVSDSHGDNDAIDELITRWPDVDLYLHAGDSETDPRSIYPFRVVRGNCDYSYEMPDEIIIPLPFGKVLMRHKKEVSHERLKKDNIKVVLFGHTHIPECIKKDDIAYINPGSLCYPRSIYDRTYMILETDKYDIDVYLRSFEHDKILKRFKIHLVEAVKPDKDLQPKEEVSEDELEELERQLDEIEQEIAEIRSKKNL